MPTFYKEYTNDTTEIVIVTPSGLTPVITYFNVDTGGAGTVTLRTFPASGTILSIDDENVIQNVQATGALMQNVEIEASGDSKVTIHYIFNGFRTNGQGHPFGTVDYRGT